MKKHLHCRLFILSSVCLVTALVTSIAQAEIIGQKLQQSMYMGGDINIIIQFADQVDLKALPAAVAGHSSRRESRRTLIKALRKRANISQRSVVNILRNNGATRIIKLWSINALAATVNPEMVQQLATLPGIDSIKLDDTFEVLSPTSAAVPVTEWNLDSIRAPELWSAGYDGTGTVVASLDTGVDVLHPDLSTSWRGGINSWYDPNGEHATPYDNTGHGTQVTGLMVGGNAGGSHIGVAPGAQWIAVKIFNDAGMASISGIHQGFQWLLDPDGNIDTDDLPDVVNNSWGFSNLVNQCYMEFNTDIGVLKSAGIAVVFSAGNEGTLGSISPADNPDSFAVGAVDAAMDIAAFSSSGPSACDGSFFPEIVAPGVNVRTADLTFGGVFPNSYTSVSGTSFSAPHVTGTMALLRQVNPDISVAELEQVLMDSAFDLGPQGVDNDYGYGLLDAQAAYEQLVGPPVGSAPEAVNDAYDIEQSNTLIVVAPGVLGNDTDMDGDMLNAVLDQGPMTGTLLLNSDGSFSYTPDMTANAGDMVSFTYYANDSTENSSLPATVTISIIAIPNSAPVAVSDTATVTRRSSNNFINLTVNDSDVDNNLTDAFGNVSPEQIFISSGTATSSGGTVVVVNNGVNYTPKRRFSGTDTFNYTVADLSGSISSEVTVNINVVRSVSSRRTR